MKVVQLNWFGSIHKNSSQHSFQKFVGAVKAPHTFKTFADKNLNRNYKLICYQPLVWFFKYKDQPSGYLPFTQDRLRVEFLHLTSGIQRTSSTFKTKHKYQYEYHNVITVPFWKSYPTTGRHDICSNCWFEYIPFYILSALSDPAGFIKKYTVVCLII